MKTYEIKAKPYGVDEIYILATTHSYGGAKTAKAKLKARYPHFKEIWIERKVYKNS